MGSFLLISCVTYYYFGDEIKIYSLSFWDLLRGRRPGINKNENDTNNQKTDITHKWI